MISAYLRAGLAALTVCLLAPFAPLAAQEVVFTNVRVFDGTADTLSAPTTVVVRASRLSEAPVTLTLFYQLIVGFLGLLLIALFSGQITHVSLTTVAVASVLSAVKARISSS